MNRSSIASSIELSCRSFSIAPRPSSPELLLNSNKSSFTQCASSDTVSTTANTMAKVKALSIPNKVLHSRVSYLYQAASYLASLQQHSPPLGPQNDQDSKGVPKNTSQAAACRLVYDLRSVSSKSQIRMSPEMKQGICKICNTVLREGSTCSTEIENKSKGGKKPWADVLVRRCHVCGAAKRYPLGSRQKRRPLRTKTLAAQESKKLEGDAVS